MKDNNISDNCGEPPSDRYRRVIEESNDVATIIDTDGTMTYVSPAVERVLGYDPEELVGSSGYEYVHPDDRERNAEAVEAVLETPDEPQTVEVRFKRADGSWCWIESTMRNRLEDDVIDGILLNSRDITERKQQKREYQELAEEYEALLETSGDAIFLADVDTTDDGFEFRFARLSPGYETQTGITTEVARGKTPQELFGAEQGKELESNYRRCVTQREPISYREELPIAEDARFWETSLAPVIIDGEIVRIVGIARNVTEQVERQRELQATNQRLESLIETAPLPIMEIDTDGRIELWNEGAEEMFGWSQEEVMGEFNPMVPDERRGEFETNRQRALSGDPIHGKEVQRKTKDGERLDLLLSVAPLTNSDGDVSSVLAILEDITEQKQLESRLRSLQETAQQLSGAESSEEIGAIAVESAVEILGFDVTGIWEYNDREDVLVPITESTKARELLGEAPLYTPGDGLAWDAFESGEVQVYDDVQTEDQRYNPETELRSEIYVPLGDRGLMSTGSVSTQVFSETDVDLFRILGATVEAALVRASREEELHRQNERLDQFASVVAHDLRNPLSVASGFLDIAEETGNEEHFEKVASAHDRIERLIDDLLTLARGETTVEDTDEVDLETVSTEAWEYVETAEATLTVTDEMPTVTGDAGRLTQLFENLFRNAVEHGGSDVRVTVGQLEGDGFYVEDDGTGIPRERRDEVFKHGVTSRDGGTGFGLSIVADIAKDHGWTVSIADGTDEGTRFEFESSR